MPLWLAVGYIALTYILFLIAPFNWPLTNGLKLFLVVALSLVALAAGYGLGLGRGPVAAKPLPVRLIAIIGGISAFAILFPSAQAYAGRWPWELLDALSDQKAAYQGLGEQLRETAGQRAYIAAARAIAAPLAFAATVLGILNWKRIGVLGKVGVAFAVGSSLTFSILRGTNKEVVDSTIIILSALAIVRARQRAAQPSHLRAQIDPFKRLAALVGIGVVLALVVAIFLARISGRLGFSETFCIGLSGICSDFNSGIYYYLPLDISRSLAMITSYQGQGYFGLSLALEEPFSSGFGLAHSPALSSLYIQFGGDESFIRDTYPYRLLYKAWDPEVQWTSMLTWIAADIGFPGAIATVGVLGFALSRSWKSAVAGSNDIAAGLFIIAVLTCFYFSANFQTTITFDSYFVLVAFVVAYKAWRIT